MNRPMTDAELEAPLDAETEAQIDAALANARDHDDEAVALSATFDVRTRMLLLELKTGQRIAIPQEDLQGISDVDPSQLTDVEILGPGTAIHFEKVMEGFLVDSLRAGIYGSQRWMDGLAQRRRERLQRAS
ncbi:DUF2442 domain-containing protein [Granulicella sibirica]|uniref:DUF2442 domain-containing protein n=1 Tax=Granulicella sibirica TaxID=2479048 RepID=A0A4Q0T2D9_9BACT|nr:DUF2442 domain-containing protein [Granulicella sibirica]RXH55646.1 hypothetical protein GRAN_2503 [Granulicella sibirica]